MKTYLVRNTQSTYGYQLKIVDDEGKITFLDPVGRDPNTKNGLKLPENPSNRKWISPKEGVDEQEIPYKESKHFGPKKSEKKEIQSSSKGWMEYLTDDEKSIIDGLREKALARKQVEIIKAKIKELESMLPKEEEND